MQTLAIVFIGLFSIFVLPLLIIMHYVTKWKATRGLSQEEERVLEELWTDAQSMQTRLNSLETILDDELPEWRRRV